MFNSTVFSYDIVWVRIIMLYKTACSVLQVLFISDDCIGWFLHPSSWTSLWYGMETTSLVLGAGGAGCCSGSGWAWPGLGHGHQLIRMGFFPSSSFSSSPSWLVM